MGVLVGVHAGAPRASGNFLMDGRIAVVAVLFRGSGVWLPPAVGAGSLTGSEGPVPLSAAAVRAPRVRIWCGGRSWVKRRANPRTETPWLGYAAR